MPILLALILVLGSGFGACPTEDSSNCVWNASTRGNGEGQSFVDISGFVIYF